VARGGDDFDPPAQERRELVGDGEPQARSLLASRVGAIQLAKLFENLGDIRHRDADTGVRDAEEEVLLRGLDFQKDSASIREFARVAEDIEEDLPQHHLVRLEDLGDARARANLELLGAQADVRRLEIGHQVRKAYSAVIAAEQSFALTEESLSLTRSFAETVAEKVRAGAASPIEETRAAVRLHSAAAEIERAR